MKEKEFKNWWNTDTEISASDGDDVFAKAGWDAFGKMVEEKLKDELSFVNSIPHSQRSDYTIGKKTVVDSLMSWLHERKP